MSIRRTIKRLLQALSVLLISPLLLLFYLVRLIGDRNTIFAGCSQFLSLFPGRTGNYLRAAFYRYSMDYCAHDAAICFAAVFSQTATRIEAGVYIGPQCNIGSSHIGTNVLVGSGVHILSGKNQHSLQRLDVPVRDQGGVFTMISIGEDTWVGNGAVIMADVGRHCVVGAGADVTHSVSDYEIVSGNPAKVVRKRA